MQDVRCTVRQKLYIRPRRTEGLVVARATKLSKREVNVLRSVARCCIIADDRGASTFRGERTVGCVERDGTRRYAHMHIFVKHVPAMSSSVVG